MITANPHNRQFTVTDVRGVPLALVCYTRSLELCARMNYETEVLDFIDGIRPGEVLFDLGACEGRFALYAAKRGVRCYAFEPEAANFQAFQENLALNPDAAANLTAINAAVGSYTGKATLNIGQPWAGGHHKTVGDQADRADLAFEAVNQQEIDIVALDEYIRTARLPWPNYLKIDVDGSEVPMLAGAAGTLRRPELQGVIFELFQADNSYGEAVSRLEAAGFVTGAHHQVPNAPDLFNVVFSRAHAA
jgi:FkbM family methyltransferase